MSISSHDLEASIDFAQLIFEKRVQHPHKDQIHISRVTSTMMLIPACRLSLSLGENIEAVLFTKS